MSAEESTDTSKIDYIPALAEKYAPEDKKDNQNYHDAVKSEWRSLPMIPSKRGDIKYGLKCNKCRFRAKEVGGDGACRAYELDASCTVSESVKDMLANMDLSKPNQRTDVLTCVLAMAIDRLFSMELEGILSGTDVSNKIARQTTVIIKISKHISELNDSISGTLPKNHPMFLMMGMVGDLKSKVKPIDK